MLFNLDYPFFGLLQKLHRIHSPSITRAAFALIATEYKGERCYLLQWNSKWGCYNFVGGKVEKDRGENGDFARTIRREITEEMGIELEKLLVGQEIKQVRLWQFSQREKRVKAYLFSIFEINFFPNLPMERQMIIRSLRWLSSKHDNIYVSRKEIMNLRTADGKPISKTVRRILSELGELSTH